MKEQELLEQNEIMSRIICSRNKLIGDLLVELPLTDRLFKKGMAMRDANWASDKAIRDEVKLKFIEVSNDHNTKAG
ncbi:MAG: hypothetical protein MUP17_10115 [candidate division Zixibacteria bacterium]|nr:hypothetical protein [candidate division Zixibacteria bacterium]